MKLGKKNNNHLKEYSGTLAAQIEETERQLMMRQHRAHIHADTLFRDLQKEMTSPTTLVLASEVGFILGELTKRPAESERKTAGRESDHASRADADKASPLKEALDLGSLLAAIYQAVPLAWIVDTFHPQEEPAKAGSAAGVKAPPPKVDLYKK